MEDKKAHEAFRVLQFARPHPALAAAAASSSTEQQPVALAPAAAAGATGAPAAAAAADPRLVNLVPDHDHVIVHFDVDCFYAQGGSEKQGIKSNKTFSGHVRHRSCRTQHATDMHTAVSLQAIRCKAGVMSSVLHMS
jgi:hypothetical protein